MDPADPNTPNHDLGDTGEHDKLYDADLRKEIVHGIHIDTTVRETDITAQLRRQRLRLAGLLTAGTIVTVAVVASIWGTLRYIEANTFRVALTAENFAPGTRYTYSVTQDGQYLLDADLFVREVIEQDGRTLYRVDQVVPGLDTTTYYWSLQEDGFYQYLGVNHKHPQIFIPLPLQAGKRWTRDIYPDLKSSPKKGTFRAEEKTVLTLPYGEVTSIEISAREEGDEDIQTIWVGEEAPIVKLLVDREDNVVAELKAIERPSTTTAAAPTP